MVLLGVCRILGETVGVQNGAVRLTLLNEAGGNRGQQQRKERGIGDLHGVRWWWTKLGNKKRGVLDKSSPALVVLLL